MRFAELTRFNALRFLSALVLISGGLTASSAGALSPSIQYFEAGPIALSGSGRQVLLSNVLTDQTFSVGLRSASVTGLWDLDDRALTLLLAPDETGLGIAFTDLSADGSTAVGSVGLLSREAEDSGAYRWRADSGFEGLEMPTTDTGVAPTFSGLRTSGDGTAVVGTSLAALFRLTPATTSVTRRWNAEGNLEDPLADPTGIVTRLAEISDDGTRFTGVLEQEVGDQVTRTAIRWTEAGGAETILPETLAAFSSSTSALSGDGQVAFGRYRPESPEFTRVFVEDAENGFIDLGALLPDAYTGTLRAASEDGSVAVGDVAYFRSEESPSNLTGEAVLWNRIEGTRSLTEILEGLGVDLKGAQLISAIDVSADGTHILGRTLDGYAFVAIIPEPSPLLLIGFGLVGLAATSRRFGRQRDEAE